MDLARSQTDLRLNWLIDWLPQAFEWMFRAFGWSLPVLIRCLQPRDDCFKPQMVASSLLQLLHACMIASSLGKIASKLRSFLPSLGVNGIDDGFKLWEASFKPLTTASSFGIIASCLDDCWQPVWLLHALMIALSLVQILQALGRLLKSLGWSLQVFNNCFKPWDGCFTTWWLLQALYGYIRLEHLLQPWYDFCKPWAIASSSSTRSAKAVDVRIAAIISWGWIVRLLQYSCWFVSVVIDCIS